LSSIYCNIWPHGLAWTGHTSMDRGFGYRMRTFLPPFSILYLMGTIQVYGRRLTALVLGTAHSHEGTVFGSAYERGEDEDEDDADADGVESIPKTVPFGDNGQARLISVRCHKHKEQKFNGLTSA
jgi:hypothetical protein